MKTCYLPLRCISRCIATSALALTVTLGAGCASIPQEAPDLSVQVGKRIAAIEQSHIRLLEAFFGEKRKQIEAYIAQVWIPTFADNFFSLPVNEKIWNELVSSGNKVDRLEFVTRAGRATLRRINEKRAELIQPLDDLERSMRDRIQAEYQQARAANNAITSFLSSAAAVDANRRRYMDLIDLPQSKLDEFVNEANDRVGTLVGGVEQVKGAVEDVEKYRSGILDLIKRLRN